MKITNTRNAVTDSGLKILVYGAPGAGKTRLCGTTSGKTIILSAEAGLTSLRTKSIDVIEIKNSDDLQEAYRYLSSSDDGLSYKWICLDSISEIAEVLLVSEKRNAKDPRQAYGVMAERMIAITRAFRDLPGRHIYFSAKMERTKDEATGAMIYGPSMPGKMVGPNLPYYFTEVMVLRKERADDGSIASWLQTSSDPQYVATDKSGCLDMFEVPNLGNIERKISTGSALSPDEWVSKITACQSTDVLNDLRDELNQADLGSHKKSLREVFANHMEQLTAMEKEAIQ